MSELSLVQYGVGQATGHLGSVDNGSGVFARQLDDDRSYSHSRSPVVQQEYHSLSERESLSSGAVSPSLRDEEQARAISPPVVRPKATATPSIPLQPFHAAVVTRDISQQSAPWHMTQTMPNAAYGTTARYLGVSPSSAPHAMLHQQTSYSTLDFRPSCQLTSSLPRTVTSVKLPLVTTHHLCATCLSVTDYCSLPTTMAVIHHARPISTSTISPRVLCHSAVYSHSRTDLVWLSSNVPATTSNPCLPANTCSASTPASSNPNIT